jgi:excisionase family DNA binding protein
MKRKPCKSWGTHATTKEHSSLFENLLDEPFTNLNRKPWLTTKEAAFYLGTSVGGIRNMVYRGQVFPRRPNGPNGKWYFRREELDTYIEASHYTGR